MGRRPVRVTGQGGALRRERYIAVFRDGVLWLEDEILALAVTLGRVGEADRERLGVLCGAAAGELERGLRDGVTREDCGGAFPLAAAWMALEDLGAGDRADGVESFTAGGLTIRMGERGAGPLRRRGLELMGPYLRDEGFSFLGVPG